MAWAGALLLAFPQSAFSAPGDLDDEFGGDGRVVTSIPGEAILGTAVTVQGDDQVLVGGGGDGKLLLARYKSNGKPDKTFGGDGLVANKILNSDYAYARDILLVKGGKILVAGDAEDDGFLARFKPNGRPDRGFGNDGEVVTNFGGDDRVKALYRHGGLYFIVGTSFIGSSDAVVARYHPNGKLDTNSDSDPKKHFGKDGKVAVDLNGALDGFFGLRFLSKGAILAAGYSRSTTTDLLLARILRKGKLDSDYGDQGTKTELYQPDDTAMNALVVTKNHIVAAGNIGDSPNANTFVRRYKANGDVDNDFSEDGYQSTDTGGDDYVYTVDVDADGKVLVGGTSLEGGQRRFILIRYKKNGDPSKDFGNGGIVTTEFPGPLAGEDVEAKDIAFQKDGKIVMTGDGYIAADDRRMVTARYKD